MTLPLAQPKQPMADDVKVLPIPDEIDAFTGLANKQEGKMLATSGLIL